jgi:post-segregation antitoxin (ccd killing protein)
MDYVPRGPKKPVNMTLSEDLVREAQRLTSNLCKTVEALLAAHVAAEMRKRKDKDKEHRIDETIRALNEHEAKYGSWGEEYSTI